ncbi:hypothetical protein ACLB2K_044475 [Fragaria x ananassa]
MSDVFEGYERQYCELSVNVSNKCTPTTTVDGEQRKQRTEEMKAALDEADDLIRKMDLEARSLQPSVKAPLLAKVREYKTDLNNLKSQVKRITAPEISPSARDELLESREADNYLTASNDQRGRLLMGTERINQSSDRIKASRRTVLETEELGVSILRDLHQQRQSLLHASNTDTSLESAAPIPIIQLVNTPRRRNFLNKHSTTTEELGVSILRDLHQQRQSLLHASNTDTSLESAAPIPIIQLVNTPRRRNFLNKHSTTTEELGVSILRDLHQQRQSLLHASNTLHGVDETITKSKKVLVAMTRRMSRNKWIMVSIVAVLVLAILLILYLKISH